MEEKEHSSTRTIKAFKKNLSQLIPPLLLRFLGLFSHRNYLSGILVENGYM
jgi:hypothetical protein